MNGRVLLFFGLMNVLLAGINTCALAQRRIVFTDRPNFGQVTMPSNIVVTSNMIDGYVKVKGGTRFIFPVCDNSVYRPFAATADGTMGAYFSANPAIATTTSYKGGSYGPLPAGAPFPLTSKDANIGKVSNREYWDINGATATRITLSWHLESGMSSFVPNGNLSKLYIVGWNGTRWVKIASALDATTIWGGTCTLNAGSMTTTAAIIPNTYLAYTFGSDLSSARETVVQADSSNLNTDSNVGQELKLTAADLIPEVETAIYPNPVRDRIYIRTQDPGKIKQVTVHDITGRKLITANQGFTSGININGLPAGMYVVNIEEIKGKKTSRKIIINK